MATTRWALLLIQSQNSGIGFARPSVHCVRSLGWLIIIKHTFQYVATLARALFIANQDSSMRKCSMFTTRFAGVGATPAGIKLAAAAPTSDVGRYGFNV